MPTRTQSNAHSTSAQTDDRQARRLLLCRSDGQFETDLDPNDISEVIKRKDAFVWLDIQDPQEQDIALLRDEFHFHPLAIEDALRAHERPKIESHEGYYFLVFYALHYDGKHQRLHGHAMSLFVGANYL